jgi:hypothetical protein
MAIAMVVSLRACRLGHEGIGNGSSEYAINVLATSVGTAPSRPGGLWMLFGLFDGDSKPTQVCGRLMATIGSAGMSPTPVPFGSKFEGIEIGDPFVTSVNATFQVVEVRFFNPWATAKTISFSLDAEPIGDGQSDDIARVNGGIRFGFQRKAGVWDFFELVGGPQSGVVLTSVRTRWIGMAEKRPNNRFSNGGADRFSGGQGGFAMSWQVDIPGGGLASIRVGFGTSRAELERGGGAYPTSLNNIGNFVIGGISLVIGSVWCALMGVWCTRNMVRVDGEIAVLDGGEVRALDVFDQTFGEGADGPGGAGEHAPE